jgi:pyruvate/2-oxoglutarate/acetoin dehydrogenase E1 component
MREVFYWQALNEALREELDRDPKVFLIGEDIGPYGGSYGVTRGLHDKYGHDRIRDTAISEAAVTGGAIGAALTGMRPVAEIMYVDFMGLAMDELCGHGAKMRYMFGGNVKVPMVMRTQGGAGRGLAGQHAQSLEAWFIHVPGLYVVMPSTPYDAKGLLKTSIRNDNLILFIEHKLLYGTKGQIPEEEYLIPLGKADIKRQGKDVTIVAYSRMVLVALEAAEKLSKEGIECEVVDPRCLNPLDIDTIISSVKKTGKVVVVSEGCKTGGVAAEIGMQIIENAFDYLDQPVQRVCAVDVPPPMSPVLVKAWIPDADKIISAVKELMK